MTGTVPEGSVETDMVEATDFLPTILDAAGLDAPEGFLMDGRSFYPQLTGQKGNSRDWMFFHFEPMGQGKGRGESQCIRFIRDLEWNLYETGELYNLRDDLDEEYPIYVMDDTPEQAAARTRLNNVFAQMSMDP